MRHMQPIATADPTLILNQLMRQPKLWEKSTYTRDFPDYPFKECDSVYIRFTPNVRESEDTITCVWMDGAIHLPAFRQPVFALMAKVEGDHLGRVFINRLKPGGSIFSHVDPPQFTDYWSRYHWVLQSGPGCTMTVGGEQNYLRPSEVWCIDHSQPHEVVNNSSVDRIHLVVDIHSFKIPVEGPLP
jgi:mannose-6-phosphate isomerase-like protein (cupin superfamily)